MSHGDSLDILPVSFCLKQALCVLLTSSMAEDFLIIFLRVAVFSTFSL